MIDYLFISPHPDDVELICGGSLIKLAKKTNSICILDLTAGERGSWGDKEKRLKEAQRVKEYLKIKERRNLFLPDAKLQLKEEFALNITQVIRELRPKFIIAPFFDLKEHLNFHPDHFWAWLLVKKALFYCKLEKIDLEFPAYEDFSVFFYPMGYAKPENFFLVDITDVFEEKKRLIRLYESQPFFENSYHMQLVETFARYYGALGGIKFAEAFIPQQPLVFDNLLFK